MHARSKNTFIVLKYAFIFSFFAHDSQTVRSKILFSKPLICSMLNCSDWSDGKPEAMDDSRGSWAAKDQR